MASYSDFQKELVDKLCQQFDCSRQDAKDVAQQADKMRKSIEADSGGMNDFEVTIDLIIGKLEDADEDRGLKDKWDWYDGQIEYLDRRGRDFKV